MSAVDNRPYPRFEQCEVEDNGVRCERTVERFVGDAWAVCDVHHLQLMDDAGRGHDDPWFGFKYPSRLDRWVGEDGSAYYTIRVWVEGVWVEGANAY